jgi:hypothetical protein
MSLQDTIHLSQTAQFLGLDITKAAQHCIIKGCGMPFGQHKSIAIFPVWIFWPMSQFCEKESG